MNERLASLVALGNQRIADVSIAYVRSHRDDLIPESRLQIILGPRGVGKTTLLLQHAQLEMQRKRYAYLSLDDLHFATHNLLDTVDALNLAGVNTILLDEIHLYNNWSRELKNAYDRYPRINIIATGSAALQISEGEADLSRRADILHLPTLSLREFMYFRYDIQVEKQSWDSLSSYHVTIANDLRKLIPNPLVAWREYMATGAYPANVNEQKRSAARLRASVDHVLRRDIPAIGDYRPQTAKALRRLLAVIAESVPFKPNISKLASQIETSRDTLYKLLDHLANAQLIKIIHPTGKGYKQLSTPEKVFLGDTNLMSALTPKPDIGTLRETFFLTAWPQDTYISAPVKGDFEVNGFIFEVGGKNKSFAQVADNPKAYLAIDDVETGFAQRIPIYLFGLLR